ncbi:MAG: TetR/AcrR family transcriptional regulator [Oscillochloris sp.]|nr:TetR/AcrR family transcriptional regulator [Oscillochloris sp.]
MSNAREQIIATTCDLLEEQGYHGTGLNQILKQSGAPKGSLYYYFPEGKVELAAEAIARTATLTAGRIRSSLMERDDVAEALAGFLRFIADQVERSGYRAGGPLTAVAMETATTNQRLNLACRDAFQQIEVAFAEAMRVAGASDTQAADLATFITATIEGGIILSRTYHSGDPLRRVADQLAHHLRQSLP